MCFPAVNLACATSYTINVVGWAREVVDSGLIRITRSRVPLNRDGAYMELHITSETANQIKSAYAIIVLLFVLGIKYP